MCVSEYVCISECVRLCTCVCVTVCLCECVWTDDGILRPSVSPAALVASQLPADVEGILRANL